MGSIKWQEKRAFDTHDLARLLADRARLPGAGEQTPVVAVSRTAAGLQGVGVINAAELVGAWKSLI